MWVVQVDKTEDLQKLRTTFAELGCESEGLNEGYVTVEIPAHVNYAPVKAILSKMEDECFISYAEPCLSEHHQY